MVTTHFSNVRPMPKAFSWSYTKLKNYETCPKRHFHYDIRKDIKEPEGEALKFGNHVHKILELRLGPDKVPFSPAYAYLEDWAKRIEAGPGRIITEQQLAITKDFEPCAWFDSENPPDKKAWYRAKIDVTKINGPAAIIIDYKTGKIVEDTPQLLLSAATLFYHYPEIKVVRSLFAWLAEGAETVEDIRREELPAMWNNLWSRIEQLKKAAEAHDYPPTPSYLCRKYCAVTSCPFHGKGPS